MEVIIDSRECGIKKYFNDENITYTNLHIGDIQIKKLHGENNKDILVLERKSFKDLKQSLKGASSILGDATDVAKGVALELVDRSLETMEEGKPRK